MTEWDAGGYARISELQQAMSVEALSLLELRGDERILDVGCGNGCVTAKIATRVTKGSVLGVDSSSQMISYASSHFSSGTYPNLAFQVGNARDLPFPAEFDLVVSFNALHWVPEQEEALRSIRAALKSGGTAQLRLVPKGTRRSLEDTLEATRRSARWASYFTGFRDPYLHWTPDQYAQAAQRNGFRVQAVRVQDKAWDFKSREGFAAFGAVTFVAWSCRIPEAEKVAFISDVLDRYRIVAAQENVFKFYQMDVVLKVQ
jgi:trans-aconitate 2-methyltransferase